MLCPVPENFSNFTPAITSGSRSNAYKIRFLNQNKFRQTPLKSFKRNGRREDLKSFAEVCIE